MDSFIEAVEKLWENSFFKAFVYLLLAFAVAFISSFIVKRICKMMRFDRKLEKWGIKDGEDKSAGRFIGKLVFLIVFILFLPPVLSSLGLDSVTEPISDFISAFIGYLPNVIAALVLVLVGAFLGKILGQIVSVLLSKTKLDSLGDKVGQRGEDFKFSNIIGKAIYGLTVLISIVEALTVLNVEAISAPALAVINAVFGAIPAIILAVIVVAVGLLIANIACGLIGNLLVSLNFDALVEKIIPNSKSKLSATKIATGAVRVLIILFILAEGVNILGLSALDSVVSAVISYLPMIMKAAIIAALAFFGAGLFDSFLKKAMPKSSVASAAGKAAIYVAAGFMILSQLEFASAIVNYAFIILLAAVAIAFAIAFGIGGRDFAKRSLEKLDSKDSADKENQNS